MNECKILSSSASGNRKQIHHLSSGTSWEEEEEDKRQMCARDDERIDPLRKKKTSFFLRCALPCCVTTIKEGNEGRGNLLTADRHMERVLYHPHFLILLFA